MNRFYHLFSAITKTQISFFSSVASSEKCLASKSQLFLFKHLTENCGFSETVSRSIFHRLSHVKDPHKPESVLSLLRNSGFSETHIRDAIRVHPQILVCDAEKILKPKLSVLQELGLTGSDLGLCVSKNSAFLTMSLERKLLPCIKILKKFLPDNRDVIRVLRRCTRIVYSDPESRLLPNISLLQSYGIVESQLSLLLKMQPRLFGMKESALCSLIERVKGMGFPVDSRMFMYALYSVSCLNPKSLERKLELFGHFGISREESMSMFRRAPSLMRNSEKKLELGLQCLLSVLGNDRMALVKNPVCLMHSIEKRLLPRYRVVGILRSKMLLKKEPSAIGVIRISEADFLQKYIFKFGELADELLLAYKGNVLKSYSI